MASSINFPLILSLAVLISGILSLLDICYFAKKRSKSARQPLIFDYARSFFPVLLFVLVVRSFIIQPYRVPSGSLEPTVMPGDFIVVNQFAYGLRLPVFNNKIVDIGEPKVGDIALFRWPVKPNTIFVKRIIGTPGDHIIYHDKVLTINGKQATQKFLNMALDTEPVIPMPVERRQENLNGVKHQIYINPGVINYGDFDIVVPIGYYFMMGDNRDNSDDSRDWGLVPEENLIGKAFMVWMSWDAHKHNIRWHRIGYKIK